MSKVESEEILPMQLHLGHFTIHAHLKSEESTGDDGNGRIGEHARQHISEDTTDNKETSERLEVL